MRTLSFVVSISFSLLLLFFASCEPIIELKPPQITGNRPPQITDQTFFIEENSANGTLVGTVFATDADKDTLLKFFIIDGNSDNVFSLDSISGDIRVIDSSYLDYETYTNFEMMVKVVDTGVGNLSDTAKITINVNDVLEIKYLLAYYPFNRNANDESGNKNHGIVYGATSSTDRKGNPYSAYKFDGINDYISVLRFGDKLPADEISVSLWVKSAVSTTQFQLMLVPDQNRFAVSVDYLHNDVNSVFWDYGWQGEGGYAPGRLFDFEQSLDYKWHHYVFISSVSRDFMKMYKDGVLLVQNTDPMPLMQNAGKEMRIGSADSRWFTNGMIDDIRIYSKVLSQNEILDLYKE
ncbi:MAG: LamG-like jellyroll fold domain-containing protein [Bacteroidota bacterium]